jgi:hypothetical protein
MTDCRSRVVTFEGSGHWLYQDPPKTNSTTSTSGWPAWWPPGRQIDLRRRCTMWVKDAVSTPYPLHYFGGSGVEKDGIHGRRLNEVSSQRLRRTPCTPLPRTLIRRFRFESEGAHQSTTIPWTLH